MTTHPRRIRPALLAAALAAGLAAAPGAATAQQAPDAFAPAAMVDGQAVTNFDVDQRARLLEFTGVAETRDEAAALDSVIDDRLKLRAAERAGIELPPGRVEEALARFAEAQGANGPAQLEARLKRAGLSLPMVRDYIETELLWTGLIQRDFGGRAEITPQEVDEEIEASGLDTRVEYSLAEIARASRGSPQETRARMAEIARRIRNGADIAATARRVSQAPSAGQGGRVGWVPAERLPPPIRQQMERMAPGGVTDPFPVQGGVMILGLLDRRETAREITAEDRERIRQRMREQRLSRLAEGRLQELRARAYVERR